MFCQITIAQGILEGKVCTTYDARRYYSFEGIPYAKPPIGELRFKAPLEPESWTGIRDAKKPGNKCAQLNILGKGFEGSEDCLYLNVYTPCLPDQNIENLPVIFFIHGGRTVVGYGDYYRPDYFIKHNVILVSINYRLNVFGFLCLHTPEVPGNAGLKDTIMALRWVKDNIREFNGDSNNITVYGESAGAAIATSYLTSKMAEGLCNKIICQSGVSISELFVVDEDPLEGAAKLASNLGHDIQDKKNLYELFVKASTKDLVEAFTFGELNRSPSIINAFLSPVVEKKFDNVEPFFEEHPFVALSENRFQKLPILATINSHEGALFLQRDGHGKIIFEENFQYFIPRFLYIKRDSPQALKFVSKLRQYYFSGKKHDESTKVEYLNLVSDHYFNRDIMLFIEILSKFHDDIYMCRFSYNGNMNTRVLKNLDIRGATHGDLIQYLFYREKKIKNATENDLFIVDTLTEAWCNFAKNGKPSWNKNDLLWLPYKRDKKLCLNVDEKGLNIESYPNFERMQFWFDLIRERAKL